MVEDKKISLENSRYVVAPGPSLMAHVGVGSPGMGTPQPAVRFTSIFLLSCSYSIGISFHSTWLAVSYSALTTVLSP